MTVGYGHGIAVTPLHLATGYATLFNGGIYRPATHPQGRPRPPGRPGAPRVQRGYQLQDARAAAAGGDQGHRQEGRCARLSRRRQDRHRARNIINRYSIAQGDELRRGLPDGRAALRDGDDARRAQGDRRDLSASAPPGGTSRRRSAARSAGSRRCSACGPTRSASRTWPKCFPTFTKKPNRRACDWAILPASSAIPTRLGDVERDGLCARPSPGRAGQCVRRVSRRALQRRGFHRRGGRARRGRRWWRGPRRRCRGGALCRRPSRARLFAELAARFFAPYPDTIVAVTGTNGKTSTVEMTRQLWRMAGHRSASIGTLGVTTADDQVRTGLTSPDIVTFLSTWRGCGGWGSATSPTKPRRTGSTSIAPRACRCRPRRSPICRATTSIITPTWTSYFAAKMRLFDEVVADDGAAVVWADDPKLGRGHRACEGARAEAAHGRRGGRGRSGWSSRASTPLGQRLMLRPCGQGGKPRAAADRRLPGRQRARRRRAGAGHRRRVGRDAGRHGARCRRCAGGSSAR